MKNDSHILTERQRSALFDLPTDEAALLQHYTLADDDLEHIRERRRPSNRLGFAVQLCAFRYPGRLLTSGETIPLQMTRFIAAQLGVLPDDLAGFGQLGFSGDLAQLRLQQSSNASKTGFALACRRVTRSSGDFPRASFYTA